MTYFASPRRFWADLFEIAPAKRCWILRHPEAIGTPRIVSGLPSTHRKLGLDTSVVRAPCVKVDCVRLRVGTNSQITSARGLPPVGGPSDKIRKKLFSERIGHKRG